MGFDCRARGGGREQDALLHHILLLCWNGCDWYASSVATQHNPIRSLTFIHLPSITM